MRYIGETAKQIFEKARLPNEVLGKIWNLADTEQRGALSLPEFIIAMHLLASYRSRTMTAIPVSLPAGLYEAAARRGQLSSGRNLSGQWPADGRGTPRQHTGGSNPLAQNPTGGPPFGAPPQSAQLTGSDWAIDERERSTYYTFFTKLDVQNRGQITGEQAVLFFSDSKLPEDVLASIWDLADVNSDGQLNRDEFAVAMHLIRQQRVKEAPPLPSTLPLDLIPPSMRSQARPLAQAVSPPADNSAFSSQAGKSAADDLFGLDTLSPPPVIQQQSTGGSFSQNNALSDPFSNSSKAASPTTSQTLQPLNRVQPSSFRPFTPTSSFGQNLTGHAGESASVSSLNQSKSGGVALASDDLLGDNDPEVSKKLTSETTELANMSNQISTLRTQMEEVQSKKGSTENNLSHANTQKQELEARLSHFRTQYEQEAKIVKTLEEQLANSRNATRKLQQELAMVEGTHQDLQNQHQQLATALQTDERENTSLKERIRQINGEINRLRPQMDKIRSEARQQKGLVAINKKQLATNVGERDKLKSEIDSASADPQEQPQKGRNLPEDDDSRSASPAVPLTRENTNPFFRKTPQSGSDGMPSSSGLSRSASGAQTTNNFDNIFGSPFPQQTTSAPPPTSFRSDSNNAASSSSLPSGRSVQSSEPDVPTPSTTPPLSSYHGSPRTADPPAPPVSRQITSSALPFRSQLARNESATSSVKVSTPSSRYDSAGAETPTGITPTRPSEQNNESAGSTLSDANKTSKQKERSSSESSDSTEYGDAERSVTESSLPGAFPATPMEPNLTGASAVSSKSRGSVPQAEDKPDVTGNTLVARAAQDQTPATAMSDFDAAFAGFDDQAAGKDKAREPVNGSANTSIAGKVNNEFPPIQDLGRDEESDSDSERGFDDDFTPVSPKPQSSVFGQSQMAGSRPFTGESRSLDAGLGSNLRIEQAGTLPGTPLPPADAQASPPTYQQTLTSGSTNEENRSHFPQEYSGLLPSREDPTDHSEQTRTSNGQNDALQNSVSKGETFSGMQGVGKASSLPPSGGIAAPLAISTGPSGTPVSTGTSEAYDSAVSQPSSTENPPFASASQNSQQVPPTSQPLSKGKAPSLDDFDDGFEDLADAKEAGVDDRVDDDFVLGSSGAGGTSAGHGQFDEFNPVFEPSPTASKPSTSASQQTMLDRPSGTGGPIATGSASVNNSFSDFEYLSRDFNGGASSNAFGGNSAQQASNMSQGQGQTAMQSSTSTIHDWDAMFSGLDAPANGAGTAQGGAGVGVAGGSRGSGDGFGFGGAGSSRDDAFSSSTFPVPPSQSSLSYLQQQQQQPGLQQVTASSSSRDAGAATASSPPPLARAISMGTEHDDPILKKLTSMGYPRANALAALERFDYDINKVSA